MNRMAPALDRHDAPSRPMTWQEIAMARAVASCPLLAKSKHRGAMRLLHARSLSPSKYITTAEAAELRACVLAFRTRLDSAVVALVENR